MRIVRDISERCGFSRRQRERERKLARAILNWRAAGSGSRLLTWEYVCSLRFFFLRIMSSVHIYENILQTKHTHTYTIPSGRLLRFNHLAYHWILQQIDRRRRLCGEKRKLTLLLLFSFFFFLYILAIPGEHITLIHYFFPYEKSLNTRICDRVAEYFTEIYFLLFTLRARNCSPSISYTLSTRNLHANIYSFTIHSRAQSS